MRILHVNNPDITYYRRVHRGIAQFAGSRDDVELRTETNVPLARLPEVDAAGYDGLILDALGDWPQATKGLVTPAVTVSNGPPEPGLARVVSDDVEVGRIAARHLLAKGYRHFAFWGHQHVIYAQQRWSGFAATIGDALGAACQPARSAARDQAMRRWLSRLPRPLGLMAMTDGMAAQVIDACHDLGLRVPEDVAVVGVDDDDLFSDVTAPSLSSVALQTDRIGYLAMECLLHLIQGAQIPPVTLVPPGPLIARQSSQGAASADALVAQAVQYLEQNLARGTNIEAMAGELRMSRRSLELRFKTALGQTPGQTLARLRFERAQDLLVSTSLPLKKIAELSGFGNTAQMGHVFRRSIGQTPMGYRRGFLGH
jgi:LacI family transcriptional regulator